MSAQSMASKKGGRPKLQPDNLPLVLAESRSRVREEVVMPAATSRLLHRYVKWVSRAGAITEDEAMSSTLDFAVSELLKRDRNWAKAKAEMDVPEGGAGDQAAAMPALPGGGPSSPPPIPRAGSGTAGPTHISGSRNGAAGREG